MLIKANSKTFQLFFIRLFTLSFFLAIFSFRASLLFSTRLENNGLSPKETIESYYNSLLNLSKFGINSEEATLEKEVFNIAENLFYISKIAPMIVGKIWFQLNTYEQNRFMNAFTISLQQKILKEIEKYGSDSLPALSLVSEETKGNFAKLNYLVSGNNGLRKFTVYMLQTENDAWKISNMKVGDNSLVRYCYSIYHKLLEEYSLEYLEAELTGRGYVVLEDFEASAPGEFPRNWSWRNQDDDKNKPYFVQEEGENKYLAAEDHGESVIIGKDVKWNLEKYPYLSFKWRARKLPEGADERYGETVDSAAGIYIVYKKKLGLIPESVKYVWSTTLPVGSTMQRGGIGKPWMIVAESGAKNLGEWHTYVFNAYEAYQKTFGGEPPETVLAIGILSDANSTRSMAYADYDDILALQKANADSGVKEFLKAE